MAYTKIVPIKDGTHIENTLGYIQNDKKTDDKILVSSFMCSAKNAVMDFENVSQYAMKKGNNIAHHIYQSFSPDDNITPQEALEIGRELMKRIYPNHQYVIATHTDREHIHNHIIVNSVSFDTFKKINSNIKSLEKLKKNSNDICTEKGLSVITPTSKNHRAKLKETIDKAIESSNNFDEFLSYMIAENYEVKQGKYLSFKGIESERFMRTDTLGTAYTSRAINDRLGNREMKNRTKTVYRYKSIRMSNRKRLRNAIDIAVKRTDSYNEFIRILSADYEIKQGKNIAFRPLGEERFLRLNSLVKSFGDDYSEEFIRLRIENPEEYRTIKAEYDRQKIDKVTIVKTSMNKYTAAENANLKIKTFNFLNENGINDISEIAGKIAELKQQNITELTEISKLKNKVSEKYDIINSSRIYWQYKKYGTAAQNIKNIDERKAYMAENKEAFDKLKGAIDVMNKAKDEYGYLPKAQELYAEIETINSEKDNLIEKNKLTKKEKEKWENVRYNYISVIGIDEEQQENELIESTQNHKRNNNER